MKPPLHPLVVALIAACRPEGDPCAIEADVSSIETAIDGLASLPPPVTVPCFLTSLQRPLGLALTSDVFSTQPAAGVRSPRILVQTPSLTLTVVPVGAGKDLVELGERHTATLTRKAEFAFPVEGPLDPEEPFLRTLAAPGATETGCHVCHPTEIEVAPGKFANTELRPPDDLIVPLQILLDEHAVCDPVEDADRCAMFSALLDHGEVFEQPFGADVATQFGPQP